MQRSLLLLLGSALAAAALLVLVEWPLSGLAAMGVGGIGSAVALAMLRPAPKPASVRKLPQRGRARAAASHVSFVPLGPAGKRVPRPAMEAGSAAAVVVQDPHNQSLRLTGDILRGMQTGGKTTRGLCSQCGGTIWLSAQRPVRATCPLCGFSRVLN